MRHTGRVPEACTCGAIPPADARFCHKCGRPLFSEPVPEPEEETVRAEIVEPERPVVARPEISFHNTAAVRVGFLAAGIASLLITLPTPAFFPLLWLTASGVLAVWLYRRRTGESLTVRAGVRMGWITGVFCFAIATVFFTISVLTIARGGGLAAFYREQLSARGAGDANIEQFIEVLQNPLGLGTVLLLSLIFVFVFFTLLPTLGGALGAKLLKD